MANFYNMIIPVVIFSGLSVVVILFQACLAAGLPWGAASMGGRFPGKYPPKMRIVALFNILLLGTVGIIVLSRASILMPHWKFFSETAVWGVVVYFFLGTILNTITPSKVERIWAPVCFVQLVTSLQIALS